MKLLITGGTGFIGHHLILQLCGKYDMTALALPSSDTSRIQNLCQIYVYNGVLENLLAFCQKEKFDGIVHLATAWRSSHTYQDIHTLIETNLTFGTQMLEVAKQTKMRFFINTATFGSYCDSLTYRPSSLYAATKSAFESIISYYALTSSTTFSNLLIYNTYGPNDKANRLFPLLIQSASTQKPLAMSDGFQYMDITYIDDVICGFDALITGMQANPEAFKNKTFSLKNLPRKTLREIVEIFQKVSGYSFPVLWGAKPKRELEITTPWEGGEVLPNWKPKISLEDGIKRILQDWGGGYNIFTSRKAA